MSDLKTISKLRAQTGAGILDVKKSLEEANGDINKAIEILRKKGEIKAAKKTTSRTTKEGAIYAYIHTNGKVAAMVELLCETDFVARNEEFKGLAKDIAMQVAAMEPLYLKPEDIPEEIIEKEKDIYREALIKEDKSVDVLDKILEGKINKYFEEVCLLEQSFIKEDKKKIKDIINEKIAKLGEKIEVGRFIRYSL